MTHRALEIVVKRLIKQYRHFLDNLRPIASFRTISFIIDKRDGHGIAAGFAHYDARISYQTESHRRFGVAHAEGHVLRQVDIKKLSRAILLVYAETKKGKRHLAKPCPECERAILKTNLRHVAYSLNERDGRLLEIELL